MKDIMKVFKAGRELNIHPAEPETPPECHFFGRQTELRLCKAAFGISPEGGFDEVMVPLHFRLEGPPGVGKNEIVYELARQLAKSVNLPFYSIQGHEEMTPEDLSILIVPATDEPDSMRFRLQASPLATALHVGGLFFFDEINRVPERALAPLASVLDNRHSLYSATTGVTLRAKDAAAQARFRFCCALNPALGEAGRGVLPDYIDERTLPVIKVGYHSIETLREILKQNITPDQDILDGFEKWYRAKMRGDVDISVRQAISLMSFTLRTLADTETLICAFDRASEHILRPEQMRAKSGDTAKDTEP